MPRIRSLNILFFAGLAALLTGCSGPRGASPAPARITAVASILPLGDFARRVAGDRVEVMVLVPLGASPHTFEPTPAQLQKISRARLMILNGVGLEYWADKVVLAADNPDLVVLVTSAGLDILQGDEDEPGGNPHVWLSPLNAMHQVEAIRDALIQVDPAGADVYASNASRYLEELRALDGEIRAAAAGFSNRRFIAFHAAWAYFARDYNLEQASIVERTPGQEPSPGDVAAVIRTARSIGAKAIFAEPQFSPKAAEAIAEESGAKVLFLDPLGRPPDFSYVDLMHYNLREISKALK